MIEVHEQPPQISHILDEICANRDLNTAKPTIAMLFRHFLSCSGAVYVPEFLRK
jgi:hypothetical protein